MTFNRMITATAIAILLAGCVHNLRPLSADGCWSYKIANPDLAHNTVVMCLWGNQASSIIYYPNNGTDSSTCSHNGSASTSGSRIHVSLDTGTCKNGRQIGTSEYMCALTGNDGLTCTTDESVTFSFLRIDDGT